jgi:hypothetical protein
MAGATRQRVPKRELVWEHPAGSSGRGMQFIGEPFCPCLSPDFRAAAAPLAYGTSDRRCKDAPVDVAADAR